MIADRADYEFARDVVQRERLAERVGAVLFSPVHGELDRDSSCSEWVLADRLPVRVQLQMHKYIWRPDRRVASDRTPRGAQAAMPAPSSSQRRPRFLHGRGGRTP